MYDSEGYPRANPVLEFQLQLNEDDLEQRDAYLDRLEYSIRATFVAAVAVTLLCAMTAYISDAAGNHSLRFVFLSASCGFLAYILVSPRSEFPRKRRKPEYEATTITMTDDYVILANESTEKKVRWGSVAFVVNSPHGLLFFGRRRRPLFWLPIRFLENDRMLDKVLHLMEHNEVEVRPMQARGAPILQESATENEGCCIEGSDLVFFGRLSESDFYHIQKYHAFLQRPLRTRLIEMLLFAIVDACVVFTLYELVNEILACVIGSIIAYLILFIVFNPHRDRKSMAEHYRRREFLVKDTRVVVSAKGIRYVNELEERTCAWELVWKVIVAREGVLMLSYAGVPIIWLSARQFTESKAMDELLKLLEANRVCVLDWQPKHN